MPSLKKDATTGALLKNSSGALVDVCDAGCTASGTSCTHCDDTTPSQYTVTLSGVNLCSCSVAHDSGYVSTSWTGADVLNAAHTLTQDTSCTWTTTLSTDVINFIYSFNSDCSSPFIDDDMDIEIVLTRSGTQWTLDVYGSTSDMALFYDVQTADVDGANQLCATVPSFTNDLTSCGEDASGAGSTGAYGGATSGTATVVCV
jgi:hypothetical protein